MSAVPGAEEIFVRYEMVRRLGSGQSAVVYEAVAETKSGFYRKVAFKVLLAQRPSRPTIDRFFEDADLATRLRHPAALRVLDYGLSDGEMFVVSDLVDGFDMESLRERAEANGASLPREVVLHMGIEAADALSDAHALVSPRGSPCLHRWLRPSSILVSRQGDVKLSDFAIAASSRLPTAKRASDEFRSPEDAQGMTPDRQSDVFSLGCVLHTLFAGYSPHGLRQPVAGPTLDVDSSLPIDIAVVLRRALSIRPRDRHASVNELASDLRVLFARRHRDIGRARVLDWLTHHVRAQKHPHPALVTKLVLSRADERHLRADTS